MPPVPPRPQFAAEGARRSVRFAIAHLTERQAIVEERELLDVALKHAVGRATLGGIQARGRPQVASGYLIRESPLYTLADQPAATRPISRSAWTRVLAERGIDRGGRQKPGRGGDRERPARSRRAPVHDADRARTGEAHPADRARRARPGQPDRSPRVRSLPARLEPPHRRAARGRGAHRHDPEPRRRRPGLRRHREEPHARAGEGARRGRGAQSRRPRPLRHPGPGAPRARRRGAHARVVPRRPGEGPRREHRPRHRRGRHRPDPPDGAGPEARRAGRRPGRPPRRHPADEGHRGGQALRPAPGRRDADRPHAGDPAAERPTPPRGRRSRRQGRGGRLAGVYRERSRDPGRP